MMSRRIQEGAMTTFKIASPLGKALFIASVGATLMAGGLITAAPPANAGCLYGGLAYFSRCDGPVQPDGTWQRCVVFSSSPGSPALSSKRCDLMGPDQHPWGFAFADPPTHIDD
jgi:hypothetical protein